MATVHHMILFGCSKPGSSEQVWNCGEMAANAGSDIVTSTPCQSGTQVININVTKHISYILSRNS